ncbi:hypothetical protein HBI55_008500 [Parastagonospora nodorum]|nr:hypothetical protein HBH47_132140 [Parastagonospora nodorum]KAH5372694.1 hypothetical protein HBI49_065470 [Parastagonospora nodorum]KAH5539880.1 hypothetical protein HBI27_109620 [Parastagonospora nodorum]KAH5721764.1 hypothetical protein HBI20_097330 [Parastagonospora nodorum]KAH6008417.1 hypothetical protein HBI83_176540 [Parastagonospora nodorum]
MSEHLESMDIDDHRLGDRSPKVSAGGEKNPMLDIVRLIRPMPRSFKETTASEAPKVPEVKPQRRQRKYGSPVVRLNGTLHHARFNGSVGSLDVEWSERSWRSKVNKADMLYLLDHAGEDISIVKTWNSDAICQYMVAVRKDRDDRRQNGTDGKVHALTLLASMATTWAATEVDAVGADADENDGDEEGVDAGIIAVDQLDTDAEGDSDDDMTGSSIEAYFTVDNGKPTIGEEEEVFDGDGLTLIEDEVLSPTVETPIISEVTVEADSQPKASSKPHFRRTMTLSRARESLLAIQQQAYNDARNSSFKDYDSYVMAHVFAPVRNTTLIHDHNGSVVFSHHTQMLVRDVIQARDTARIWRDRLHMEQGNQVANSHSVKVGREELCERLIAILTDWLEVEDVDAKEQAKNLVEELLDM